MKRHRNPHFLVLRCRFLLERPLSMVKGSAFQVCKGGFAKMSPFLIDEAVHRRRGSQVPALSIGGNPQPVVPCERSRALEVRETAGAILEGIDHHLSVGEDICTKVHAAGRLEQAMEQGHEALIDEAAP